MADALYMNAPSLSNVNVASSVSIAVASKQLDAARAQGEAVNSLIRDAANVSKASRGAVSASPGPGESGGRVNVTG